MRRVLLALAVLLAGCGSPPEASPAENAAPSTTTAASPSSSASAPVAPPATYEEQAYSFDGRTWASVCAAAGPTGHCQPLLEGSDLVQAIGVAGIVRIQGSLSWSEGNPEAGISLAWDDNGSVAFDQRFYAVGTSPLTFEWDTTDVSGEELGYHVASYVGTAPPVQVSASPGQAWRLEATLTVRTS